LETMELCLSSVEVSDSCFHRLPALLLLIFCRLMVFGRRSCLNAVACIEILDIASFCDRVAAALPENTTFPGRPGRQRIGRQVEYYRESADCNPRWALPDVIATSKFERYAWQDEFRLVFSLTDALNFENISGRLIPPGISRPAPNPGEHHCHLVNTKSLRDICRLHDFK
jgi:hypothetical protein